MLHFIAVLVLGVLAQQTFADEPEAIVGGTPAKAGEFPYQCSLNLNGNHFCGCSIIGPTKILTAAHCLQGIVSPPYSGMRVFTGSINSKGGQSHTVRSARIHPQYAPGPRTSWNHDVAVITLLAPIKFDSNQSPISLSSSTSLSGTQCVLSGWGMIRAKGPIPQYLLKMNSKLVDKNSCKTLLRAPTLTSSHVCAFAQRGIGACQGDSGGPLVCNGKQVGIVSWVVPCAEGYPDVYTSVYDHLEFIQTS